MLSLDGDASLRIAKSLVEAAFDRTLLQQRLVESLAEVLSVQRILIYGICEQNRVRVCEIVAAVPLSEHMRRIGKSDPDKLAEHPDIEAVSRTGKILIVDNPRGNPLTHYFGEIIEARKIHQIVYFPLIDEGEMVGVLVLDATVGRESFGREEIEYCSKLSEELIARLVRLERTAIDRMWP